MKPIARRTPEGSVTKHFQDSRGKGAELGKFLEDMRGVNPHQNLGVGEEGGLARGMIAASVATLVLVAAFTAGPYAWEVAAKSAAAAAPAAAVAEKPASETAKPAEVAAEKAPPTAETPAPAVAKQSAQAAKVEPRSAAGASVPPKDMPALDKQQALDRLGVGQTKTADPKTNPLENSADDLLKDLK